MKLSHATYRVLAGVVVVGGTMGIVAASGAFAAPAARAPHSTPGCVGTSVVNWLNTQAEGSAGHFNYTLEFTNLTSHSCTLRGYPGVSAVNLSDAQIGAAAERDGGTVKTITLGAGKTATASLIVTDTGMFSPSACKAVTAAGLRVYAPNQTASDVIPYPFLTCSKSSEVSLDIQPVV